VQAQLKIFSARSGSDSARLEYPDGRCMHLHSAMAPEKESESLLDTPIWGNTVVVLGVGLGYQLDQIDFSSATRVVLVDVYDQLLERASSRLHPRIEALACVNARDIERLIQALVSSSESTLQILRHPASVRAFPELYESVECALIQSRIKPRQLVNTARRVLLMQGTHFLEREVGDYLGEGANLSVLHYRMHPEGPPRQTAFQELIESERPEIIFTIGFKGFDRQGTMLQMAERYGIPVAVWFLDDPRPASIAFEAHIGSNIHAFVWDKAYAPWLEKRGYASVQDLALGSSARVFDRPSRGNQDVPMSFVGSALGPDFLQKIKTRFLWDPAYQDLVDECAFALLAGKIDALTVASGDLPYNDEKNRVWFANVVIHTASHIKRRTVCQSLLNHGLETFGDPGTWQSILGPQARCHSAVDYYTELVKVYQRSVINLNITSCQMPTTVNQRLFDVPLAGAFLLTDPQADATVFFEEDKEVVVYQSIEEAEEKARFYATHTQARTRIVEAARKRVLGEHLVSHRVARILSAVFD
jgi:spore maturation protein CgeB